MIETGKLNKRLVFLDATETQDGRGQVRQTWNRVADTVWGSITPISGRQVPSTNPNTITSLATHQIVVRYNPNLVGHLEYRIRYDGWQANLGRTPPSPRQFAINSILDTEERHFELRVLVTEVAAG